MCGLHGGAKASVAQNCLCVDTIVLQNVINGICCVVLLVKENAIHVQKFGWIMA